MKTVVKVITMVLAVVGSTVMTQASGQQADQPNMMQLPAELADFKLTPLEELLLRKLDLTQDVLEAVVVQDPESVREYAQEFVALVESEEWNALGGKDPSYAAKTSEFRKAVRALHVMSKDKDPKNLTKGYYNMVDRCVACHASGTTKQAE